jgi:hypothetical protein
MNSIGFLFFTAVYIRGSAVYFKRSANKNSVYDSIQALIFDNFN